MLMYENNFFFYMHIIYNGRRTNCSSLSLLSGMLVLKKEKKKDINYVCLTSRWAIKINTSLDNSKKLIEF